MSQVAVATAEEALEALQLARQLLVPLHTLNPEILQVAVATAEEALEALRRGSRARQKARTALNGASSRSHSIFTVAVDARQVLICVVQLLLHTSAVGQTVISLAGSVVGCISVIKQPKRP